MHKIIFSTVIYKTPISQIKSLIDSITSLDTFFKENYNDKIIFELFIFDNYVNNNFKEVQKIIKNKPFNINFKSSNRNLGYGQGHNKNFEFIKIEKNSWFISINPDVSFKGKHLYKFILFLINNNNLSCAAPLIYLPNSKIQYSAKKNPTVISLLSSRFTIFQKIPFLKNHLYKNQNRYRNYKSEIINCSFLSGCFLAIPTEIYSEIGGFSKKYFLHFEDADIVRRCSLRGRTIHCPLGFVTHIRGRGSHNSLSQQLCLVKSYFFYILRWGIQLM